MNYSIVTEYSLLYLFPIVLIAIVLIYFQYFKGKSIEDKFKVYSLAVLRFLVYILLPFILLNPQIKSKKEKIIKPTLFWLQDVSQSMVLTKDSSYYKNNYFQDIEAAKNQLSAKFSLKTINFDSEIRTNKINSFKGGMTNISKAFSYLKNNFFSTQNSLVVLASDGIFNKGNNPRYIISDINMPIYTLTLGDTLQSKDLLIQNIKTNKISFLNNKLPVQVRINAKFLSGKKTKMKIYNNSNLLYSKNVTISSDDDFFSEDFLLDMNKAGLQTFTIVLSPLSGETNISNNKMNFAVDVKDKRRQILMLFDTYHPDISAINSALKSDLNFEFTKQKYSLFKGDLSKYNMIIVYQARKISQKIIELAKKIKIPILYIVGANTDLNFINSMDLGFSVKQKIKEVDYLQYYSNNDFKLFKNSKSDILLLEDFPPLVAPFANLIFSSEPNVLSFQKIKASKTNKPLIAFWDYQETKNAIIFGEGIWRWKYYNYRKESNHNVFNKLINNICQYVSLVKQKDKLVLDYKRIFNSSESVNFSAEIYNQTFQRINDEKLTLKLTDDTKKNFLYQFIPTVDSYTLSIENLPVGKYSFSCFTDNRKMLQQGRFVVIEDKLESKNTLANHGLMQKLALLTNGESFYKNNLNDLVSNLNADNKFKSVVKEIFSYNKLLASSFLLILCFVLIGLEWFLHKLWSL